MDQNTFLQLMKKVGNDQATSEEKLMALKELNASAKEFSQLLKDLLQTIESKRKDK